MKINILTTTTDQTIWKQERIIFWAQSSSEIGSYLDMWTDLHGSASAPIARYIPTADHAVYIDVSDYVRTYPEVETFYFNSSRFENVVAINVNSGGLINPASVYIPEHDYTDYALIVPPQKIISPEGFAAAIGFEFYARPNYLNNCYISEFEGSTLAHYGQLLSGTHFLDDSTITRFSIREVDSHDIISRNIEQPVCGVQYALVTWRSFTGKTRRHAFEITKITSATDGVVSLADLDNEYREFKGREDSLTLRLQQLSRYDFWYYSDLINSPEVKISFDGVTEYRVQVTTKSATLPENDEGKLTDLEINVNWRKYDATPL